MPKFKQGDLVKYKSREKTYEVKEFAGTNVYNIEEYWIILAQDEKENEGIYAYDFQLKKKYDTVCINCECGMHLIYGQNCNSRFHSFWCPEYKE